MDVVDCRLTIAHCGLLIGQLDYQALLDWTGDRNVVTKVSNSIIALHFLLHHKNSTTPILSYLITIKFMYQQANIVESSRTAGGRYRGTAGEVDAIGKQLKQTQLDTLDTFPVVVQCPPPTTSVP